MNAISRTLLGTLAGAAGTAALNAATYGDMAVRGRPPSELPDKMAQKLAELTRARRFARPRDQLGGREKHQRSAIAALLGYADGFAAGALFGLIRPLVAGVPCFWAGIGLAVVTMAMSEGAAAALRQTDPATWPLSAWMEDVGPRCVYGWVTCAAFDRMTRS